MHYEVVLTPKTSLYLGRDRATRVSRNSFHFIPSSTIAGAVNTYLYQRGLYDLMGCFRFSNLYFRAEDGEVWIPSPRNVLFCPNCGKSHIVKDLRGPLNFKDLVCDCEGRTLRKPHRGFIRASFSGLDGFSLKEDMERRRRAVREAQLIGRTALDRRLGIQEEGKLHFVEVLNPHRKAGGDFQATFHGQVSVFDEEVKESIVALLEDARLRVGGLLGRGCGDVRLNFRPTDEDNVSKNEGRTLLVAETPLLPVPYCLTHFVKEKAIKHEEVMTTSQMAEVGVCERWSIKLENETGGGLISFPNILAVGSVFLLAEEGINDLADSLFFYEVRNSTLILHQLGQKICSGEIGRKTCVVKTRAGYEVYNLNELWSLGFGKLRWLQLG